MWFMKLRRKNLDMNRFQPVTHVIFDMDGVILDTEPLYIQASQNIFQKFGKNFNFEMREKMMGFHRNEAAKFVVKEFELPITWEEYVGLLLIEYKTTLTNPKIFPGAEKLVRHLHKHNIPISVASSSSKDTFDMKISNYKELFKLFDHIICGSTDPDVQKGKPSPDIFLVSASRFPDKPSPEKCLVIEDAPNGVQAALSAGMQVVMVPNQQITLKQQKGATLVVTSLDQVPLEKFGLPPIHGSKNICGASCNHLK